MKNRQFKKSKPLEGYLYGRARQIFRWSPTYKGALNMAEAHGCRDCGERADKYQIDHREPVVPVDMKSPVLPGHEDYGNKNRMSWDSYFERLYCPPWQVAGICIPCHKKITKEQNAQRPKRKRRRSGT